MNNKMTPEDLKSFVRKIAPAYLNQQNINSVGIGYKIKGGKVTDQLSIQFTVNEKIGLESLESINEEPIPESIDIDGVEVPTDVIQRNFKINLKTQEEKIKSIRKQRLDPVLPGCSVGHPTISAGTVGCVVYDNMSGEEYILSNWHVLQGHRGVIGDKIVQPGKHDDSRITMNYAGHLVNSHLGSAGDCAVAKIDLRQLNDKIIDIDVQVKNIADPEIGDKVIKSGRTTSVTYGIVSRVHVTTKINYEGVGYVNVGGFEYTPDPDNLPENGEISMGGDSGSAVMLVKNSKPSSTMVGLHFAGEVGNAPEHAIACYSRAVFEKLGISTVKPKPELIAERVKRGYNSNFLTKQLRPPYPVNQSVYRKLLKHNNEYVFDYTHFSLVMNKDRKLAAWVAWNIDGGNIKYVNRVSFRKDPGLPEEAQIGNELYLHNDLDRGHLARRAELCWGSEDEAKQANSDSFYYSNIAPQHSRFNQSKIGGIWGKLENGIFDQAKIQDLKVSVMAGPIFNDHDNEYRGIKIPKEYWKIISYIDDDSKELKIHCFILSQTDLIRNIESLDLDEFKLFKVPVQKIVEKIDFKFDDLGSSSIESISEEFRQIESLDGIID
jgi:endonuclease G